MKLTRKGKREDRMRQYGVSIFALSFGLMIWWLMDLGFFGERIKVFTHIYLLFLSAFVAVRTIIVEMRVRRSRE
jgi:hypothetical protein